MGFLRNIGDTVKGIEISASSNSRCANEHISASWVSSPRQLPQNTRTWRQNSALTSWSSTSAKSSKNSSRICAQESPGAASVPNTIIRSSATRGNPTFATPSRTLNISIKQLFLSKMAYSTHLQDDSSSARTSSVDTNEVNHSPIANFPGQEQCQLRKGGNMLPNTNQFLETKGDFSEGKLEQNIVIIDKGEVGIVESMKDLICAPSLDATSVSDDGDPMQLIETASKVDAPTFAPSALLAIEKQDGNQNYSGETSCCALVSEQRNIWKPPVEHINCDPIISPSASSAVTIESEEEEDDTIMNSCAVTVDCARSTDLSNAEAHAQCHFASTARRGVRHTRSESILGIIVGDDGYEDDESTVCLDDDLMVSNKNLDLASSFVPKDTVATNDTRCKKVVRFEDETNLMEVVMVERNEMELVEDEEELEDDNADFITKARSVMGRVPEQQKMDCEEALSQLSCAFHKSMDKTVILNTVARLGELFQVPRSADNGSGRKKHRKNKNTKKTKMTKRTATDDVAGKTCANRYFGFHEESQNDQTPEQTQTEETLRGLEVFLTDLYGSLQQRHRSAVLRAQYKQQKRQKKKKGTAEETDDGTDERIRKASLKTSRPLRYMALQMASYDTKEALRSILTKWEP